jgi:predicted aspartyl protease
MISLRLSLHPATLAAASLCAFLASAHPAEAPMFKVTKDHVPLYSRQEEHSEIITELKAGDQLTPLANSVGSQGWYFVQTRKGETGWVRGEDVQGGETLEKLVRESDSVPSYPVIPSEGSKKTDTVLSKETNVLIETHGSGAVIVPVEINHSVRTYMVLDTGAALTQVSPALAKRLGLQLGQRVGGLLANGAVISSPTSRLKSLKVGAAEVQSLPVRVEGFSRDPRVEGLLGIDFLGRFRMSIDSRNSRLILSPR